MKLFDEVCVRLDEARVQYALIGAAAMGLQGAPRSTQDLDLLSLDVRVPMPPSGDLYVAEGLK